MKANLQIVAEGEGVEWTHKRAKLQIVAEVEEVEWTHQ